MPSTVTFLAPYLWAIRIPPSNHSCISDRTFYKLRMHRNKIHLLFLHFHILDIYRDPFFTSSQVSSSQSSNMFVCFMTSGCELYFVLNSPSEFTTQFQNSSFPNPNFIACELHSKIQFFTSLKNFS